MNETPPSRLFLRKRRSDEPANPIDTADTRQAANEVLDEEPLDEVGKRIAIAAAMDLSHEDREDEALQVLSPLTPQDLEKNMETKSLYVGIRLQILIRCHEHEEAARLADAFVLRYPNQRGIFIKIFCIYLAAKDYDNARIWHEKAVRSDPKNATKLQALSRKIERRQQSPNPRRFSFHHIASLYSQYQIFLREGDLESAARCRRVIEKYFPAFRSDEEASPRISESLEEDYAALEESLKIAATSVSAMPQYQTAITRLRRIRTVDRYNYYALAGLLADAIRGVDRMLINELKEPLIAHYPDDPDVILLAAQVEIRNAGLTLLAKDQRAIPKLQRAWGYLNRCRDILSERPFKREEAQLMQNYQRIMAAAAQKIQDFQRRCGATVLLDTAVFTTPPDIPKSRIRKFMQSGQLERAKKEIDDCCARGINDHSLNVWRLELAIHTGETDIAHEMFQRIRWCIPARIAEQYQASIRQLHAEQGARSYIPPNRIWDDFPIREPVDALAAIVTSRPRHLRR